MRKGSQLEHKTLSAKEVICKGCKLQMVERTHDKTGNVYYCPKCAGTRVLGDRQQINKDHD